MDLTLFQQNIDLIKIFLENLRPVEAKEIFLKQILQHNFTRIITLRSQVCSNALEKKIQDMALANVLSVFKMFPNNAANEILQELLHRSNNVPEDINCRCILAGLLMFRAQMNADLNQLDLVFQLLDVHPILSADKNLVDHLLKDANAVRSQLADQVIRYFPKIT